jgi:hypothetical protein
MATPQAERRRALVVANARYDDEALGRLTSPARDAEELGRVLEDPDRCGFEVTRVVDGGSAEVAEAVEGFLAEVERNDLLLLYFSCHGLKDEQGRLYFAMRNTRRDRLRSTTVPAAVVNDLLLGSRSRRKVLLLDCCYGGAFAKGMQVKADPAVHTADQFDARGLVVLTASDSTQYAFDGDVVRGSVTPSRFTAVLVDGLSSGEADLDGDGYVTVDDAYDFVRRRLADEHVPQSPRKWEFDVAGDIVLGRTGMATETGPRPSAAAPLVAALPRGPAPASVTRAPTSWWLGWLAVLAGSVGSTWLIATWVNQWLADAASLEYFPDLDDLRGSVVILAAAWAAAYAVVAGRENPWRRAVAAYRDLLAPDGTGAFVRGLLSAVPVNVLLVGAASCAAGAVAYAWSGSTARDNVWRLAFVLLAVAALARYVTRERGRAVDGRRS